MEQAEFATLLEAEAHALIEKQRHGRQQRMLFGNVVRLASLRDQLPELARRIAVAVADGTYRVDSVQRRVAQIEGKARTLYQSNLEDYLLAAALGQVITLRSQGLVSARVYSYRRGVSSWDAVADFMGYTRAHRRERPNPRMRGLYVIRRDVKAYGDSIPLDDDSSLWPAVGACLEHDPWLAYVTRSLIRPVIGGAAQQYVTSVPTGSPLQPPLCNLYLAPADRVALDVPGAFYARYGDDILFAHPDPSVAQRVGQGIDEALHALRLLPSPGKCADYYFNGAGRRSVDWSNARGVSQLVYLGGTLSFHGTLSLKRDKARTLTRGIAQRIAHGLRLSHARTVGERAQVATGIVNAVLDPRHPLSDRASSTLVRIATDRGSLRDLDYRIALTIAEQVTRSRGVRAFRQLSYAALRGEHGLVSLCHRRRRSSAGAR